MVVPRIGRTRLGHRTLKCALTIGTQSAQSIRASGTSAASTGRTRDRTRPMLQQRQKVLAKAPSTRDRTRPMLQQRQKVLAKAPSTRDPRRTLKGGEAHSYAGKKGAKPDRQACRKPGSHAPDDARDEPRKTRRLAWPHISANSEIRKRDQSNQRQSPAADFSHSSGPGRVFLRRRTQRADDGPAR